MRVLFVCLGNICRSPTVEAVARQRLQRAGLADAVQLDSAGTGDWHVGRPPDPRSVHAALARGYDLSALRGRQVCVEDFHRYSLILAMDSHNLAALQALRPANASAELDLFLRRYGLLPEAMPDPYHGAAQGFEQVLELAERGVDALIAELRRRL